MTSALPACRSCGAEGLELVLSLGRTPLANALLTREQLTEPEARYPLDLAFCPACTLVQITETVPPAKLFSDYLYFSSFSDTMLRHAEALVTRLIAERHLGPESLAIEIASNDGYLLQYFAPHNVPVLGIEPAANIARVAVAERGVPTLCEFFGHRTGERLRAEGQTADVLHAHNVLAHVADLNDFVSGMRAVLKRTGVVVVELGPTDAAGNLEPSTVGQVVLSVPSPEALARQADEVHRVITHAGEGTEPLIVEVEAAEELREEELKAVVEAASHTTRAVILRIIRDA